MQPRSPLPLDGPVAARVRALMAGGRGRPSMLEALRAEGHDVSDQQLRTLYGRLKADRDTERAAVREETVARAVEQLAPGVPADLAVLERVRDTMVRGMRRAMGARDFGAAARCAGQATAAAKARLGIVGVRPDGAGGPLLSEAEAAKILREEFGDTGALREDDDAAPGPVAH